jgi:hypothetical protein
LDKWLQKGHAKHKPTHVTKFKKAKVGGKQRKLGQALARQLAQEKAILGVFDEGCMGMFNAIIPDHLLNSTGVYKERLEPIGAVITRRCAVGSGSGGGALVDGGTGNEISYRA